MVQDAVIRQIGIVGEAASKLSPVPMDLDHPDEERRGPPMLGGGSSTWCGERPRETSRHLLKKLNAAMAGGGGVFDEWTARTGRALTEARQIVRGWRRGSLAIR
jgi:hypothetical protein